MNNIVIVGVLNKPSSTNIWMATSFYRLGYNIIPVNYRDIINKYGLESFEETLIDTIKKYNPVLTIFCKCNGVNSDIITECNKYTKTWLWFMDSYLVLEQLPEVIQNAVNANYSSCTCLTSVKLLKDKGANAYHILEGADSKLHKPTEVIDKYKSDFAMAGAKTELRDAIGLFLSDNGYDVRFYGLDYDDEWVDEKKYSEVYSSAKFALSVNTFSGIPNYFSSRVFECMACGACVVHFDPTDTIKEYFEDGKEIIVFKDKDELLYKIKDVDFETAKVIGINARKKVLENYTWDNSVNKILEVVNVK